MNILSLNIFDLGGLSYNLCEAINQLTPHHATSIVSASSFSKKPIMAVRKKTPISKMRRLVQNADVIHINENWRNIKAYKIKPAQCKGKKIIYHCHGTVFRKNSKFLLNKFKRTFPKLKVITSTPDLLAYIPKSYRATWFPSIVPIESLQKTYKIKRNVPPVVYYSPSGSSTKTMKNVIRRVVQQLRSQGMPIKLVVTTNTRHSVNMARKSKADIYYDEILPSPFYGVNAIEAGAFKMAVICNMNQYARKYMQERKLRCPFIVCATEPELTRQLKKLSLNKQFRKERGEASFQYVKRVHSPKVCINRFLKLIKG